jgi:hypothetical protein
MPRFSAVIFGIIKNKDRQAELDDMCQYISGVSFSYCSALSVTVFLKKNGQEG